MVNGENQIDSVENESENTEHDCKEKNSLSVVDSSLSLTINHGYQFWRDTLHCSKYILAPMVDQSELAFRIFVRQYGVHCTYSPMFNSNIFVKDVKYQRDCLQVSPSDDSPMIVQFCANKPEVFLQSAKIASSHCDAIDINLGCPQTIARRGHYGAFLQDEWDLIHQILSLAVKELDKPVTAKIRVFPDMNKTIQYAKMVESTGVALLTVHGRIREQKGPLTGMADWDKIKAVKNAVNIPVFANGNIQSKDDVDRCLEYTGVDGVMSAEGILHNPAIFTGEPLSVWNATRQYIDIARRHTCQFSYVRGHVFKFLHHCLALAEHEPLRTIVAKTHSLDQLVEVADQLESRYRNEYEKFMKDEQQKLQSPDQWPVFICKPYYRPTPSDTSTTKPLTTQPEQSITTNETTISKNQLKRLHRSKSDSCKKLKSNSTDNSVEKVTRELCVQCPNPKGTKCEYQCCRQCCRNKTYAEILDCKGHRFVVKSRNLRTVDSTPN